jgi:hypothetical protein
MDPNENEAGSEPQSGVEASDPNDQLNIMDEDDDDDMDGGVAELEEEDGYNTAEEEEHDHDDTLEPDDSTANGLRFASACVKMEKVWQNKMAPKRQQRWNGDKRKDTLLPRQMIEDFHRDRQTLYPYIRLLLPEQDSYRQFKMKDKYLADGTLRWGELRILCWCLQRFLMYLSLHYSLLQCFGVCQGNSQL